MVVSTDDIVKFSLRLVSFHCPTHQWLRHSLIVTMTQLETLIAGHSLYISEGPCFIRHLFSGRRVFSQVSPPPSIIVCEITTSTFLINQPTHSPLAPLTKTLAPRRATSQAYRSSTTEKLHNCLHLFINHKYYQVKIKNHHFIIVLFSVIGDLCDWWLTYCPLTGTT